ncbi:MAG: hypothetical protein WCF08_10265 [Anaerolineaceae bacterium]
MKRLSLSLDKLSALVALVILIASLLLNWSSFFPTLGEINPWDEAGYVKSGQDMIHGQLPIFAGSPLTAALYAATGIIFHSSPFWFIHSVAAGRLIAYALIWLSAYLIGKRLTPHTTPLVLLCMLLAAPFLIKLLRFPSDPLLIGFAGLALWQLLTYLRTRSVYAAVLAGVFMALAATARNDGLILFIAALIWLMIFCVVKRIRWTAVTGFVIPFICIIGGYVLIYGLQTGNYSLGTGERTYDNFEAGQIAVYSGEEGLNAAVDAKREARRLFGTPEENGYSVVKAIARNPQAFIERLKRVTLELPGQIIKAYSGKWVVLLTFWAAWGVVTLLRKREWSLIGLFLIWFTPFLSGFVITIFRTGHLLFPSLVVLSLAAVGLMDFSSQVHKTKIRLFGLVAMLILLIIGLVMSELVVIYAAGLSLAAMLLVWLGITVLPNIFIRPTVPLLLFFVVGLILHGPYPGIGVAKSKLPPEEQALLVMVDELPAGARVLAGSPGVVYAAKMTYLGLASTDVPIFTSPEEFGNWLESQSVDAIYVDNNLTVDNQVYWSLLKELSGVFHTAYADQTGEIQVWIRDDRQ